MDDAITWGIPQVCRYVLEIQFASPTACLISHHPRPLTLISGNLSLAQNAIYPSHRIHLRPHKSHFGLLNADMSSAISI
jgi:hypothetical protein